jgi:hypothetical protein
MKSLYDTTHDLTDLRKEVVNALRPIFAKWVELGYSAREIAHVAMHELILSESSAIIRQRNAKKV